MASCLNQGNEQSAATKCGECLAEKSSRARKGLFALQPLSYGRIEKKIHWEKLSDISRFATETGKTWNFVNWILGGAGLKVKTGLNESVTHPCHCQRHLLLLRDPPRREPSVVIWTR